MLPCLATGMQQRWQRIWIGSGSYSFFLDPDPVLLKDADPGLILLITFKLIVDVCQNIR